MTQYQNYKSDFVLRESFVDGAGKPVALPEGVDFVLRYWVRPGHEYMAGRQGDVYQNCAPEGDTLLVFFKDHNLCEGALHHELHLALDNEAFSDGVQNVYYPADMHILLWDKASSADKLHSGLVADYTRGRAFTFGDFTPEQIEQLQQPAREAAGRYDAALGEYERRAGEQVQRITEAADELEGQVQDFARESGEMLGSMGEATEAAQQAVEAAERRTGAAVTAADQAAADARQAKADAEAATRRALAAEQAAAEAAEAARRAKADADAAIGRALEAERAATEAAAAANGAATDAGGAATDATEAARKARQAIENCDTLMADGRGVLERAEAAAAAANEAKHAADTATAAANAAKQAADQAAANARQAKTDADAATAAANEAARRAEAAAQHTEQERALLEVLIERASIVAAGVPTGMRVESPAEVTLGNPARQYVRAKVLPVDALQNVLYLSDGKAVDVLPDGEIVAKAEGTSTVHVIPTDGTRFYKTIQVAAVPPRMRVAAGGIRLDANGNIRLT